MLTININSIKSDPEWFETEVNGSCFNPEKENFFQDPVEIKVQIYRTGEQVIIKGKAATQVFLNCSRCLSDFKIPLETEFMFVVVPMEHYQAMNSHADREMTPDDPAIIPCYDNQLDLIPEIQSALLLAIPVKPLCKKDCRGLCPQCGARLDEEPCTCEKNKPTGPFAELGKLLDQDKS